MIRWLITIAALFTLPAQAQIYKCTSKEGRVTFQDSQCLGSTGTTMDIKPSGSGVVVVQPKVAPKPARRAGEADDDDQKASPGAPRSTTQAERDAAQLKAMENDRKRRAVDFDLVEAERVEESVRAAMDRDVADLRERKDRLTASVPGSVPEQNVGNELQTTIDRYQLQLRAAQDRVADLRRARDALTTPGPTTTGGRRSASSGAKQ